MKKIIKYLLATLFLINSFTAIKSQETPEAKLENY